MKLLKCGSLISKDFSSPLFVQQLEEQQSAVGFTRVENENGMVGKTIPRADKKILKLIVFLALCKVSSGSSFVFARSER